MIQYQVLELFFFGNYQVLELDYVLSCVQLGCWVVK